MFAIVKRGSQSLRKKKNTRRIIKRKNKVIMKPTLEEVKEKFKDAETVQENCYNKIIFEIDFNKVTLSSFGNYVQGDKNYYLWSKEHGYAKILTYKEQKFEITKEQILKYNMKDEFPDVFKKELVVGKWYKGHREFMFLFNGEHNTPQYGFDCAGNWNNELLKHTGTLNDVFTEATPQEVETALIRKWEKKGGVGRDLYIELNGKEFQLEKEVGKFQLIGNILFYQGAPVMNDGKFAQIIETITIQEAEKLLKEQGINKKIVG